MFARCWCSTGYPNPEFKANPNPKNPLPVAHSPPFPHKISRIYVAPIDGGALTTLTVRLWLDTIEDLQAQAFVSDTPSQRQQLVLDGNRLKDDGRVLALHGVVSECTIQLVSV